MKLRALGSRDQKSGRESRADSVGGLRVAIVDDMPLVVNLYDSVLRMHGHNIVLHANSGEEILRQADAGKLTGVDVIIIDYSLRRIDGLKTGLLISEKYPGIRVVIATANYSVTSDITEAGFECLKKPFSVDELLSCVRRKDKKGVA